MENPEPNLNQCSSCRMVFKWKGSLKRHIDQNICATSCETCNAKYSTKGSMKRHIEIAHQKKAGEFTCDICEKRFFTKSQLSSHIIGVHDKSVNHS